ncbi:WD40 repeat domain-containing protein [Micromonospora sp. WMMC415]|uniref:WD40 repeat domain-containing protein n=1 Tax=Micromonospora sp. WMMC415 TaxID=2675222 RepID=UPI001E602188|nr:WD40 repeat domain-containing protein [Micromonospora sp. WMMC415]
MTLGGHTGPVRLVTITSDDRRVISGGEDGVRVWDAETGQMLARFAEQAPPVNALAVDANGTWVVTAESDPVARVWEIDGGRLKRKLPGHAATVTAVVASPDGSWIATSSGCTIRLWNASSGTLIAALSGHRGEVTMLAASPDGNWLATAGRDETARMWNTATATLHAVLPSRSGWFSAITFGANSKWLATASGSVVTLWKFLQRERSDTLDTSAGAIVDLKSSPDSSWLVGAGKDAVIRIWSTESNKLIASLGGHSDELTAVQVAPDASWIASTSLDGTVRTWDVSATGEQATPTDSVSSTSVSAAGDGSWIVTTGADHGARLWATDESRFAYDPRNYGLSDAGTPRTISSSAHDAVVVNSNWIATHGTDPKIRLWDQTTNTLRAELALDKDGRTHRQIKAIAGEPTGKWLVALDSEHNLRAWNVRKSPIQGKVLSGALNLRVGLEGVVAFAVRDEFLLIGELDGSLRVWDLESDSARWSASGEGPLTALEILPNKEWIATSSNNDVIALWRIGEEARVKEIATNGIVTSIKTSPDGRYLAATTSRGSLEIFATDTWQRATTMRVDGDLRCCTWIPASQLIATVGLRGLYMFELMTS